MKNSLSIKVDLQRNKPNSKGEYQIYIFLNTTINSKRIRKQIFTGYSIIPDLWDSAKGQIKNVFGADIANAEIASMLAKIYKIKAKLDLENKIYDPDLILEIFNNENQEIEANDYIAFVKKELQESRKDYSLNYYKDMLMNLEMLKEFCGGKLYFEDITPTFLKKYRYHLEHEKKNKTNSVYQKLTTIRKFVNEALRQNLTKYYAFKDYQLKTEQVEKEYLELHEVESLHKLYKKSDTPERIKVTLHYFLLSCYTGLRLSDIKRVTKESIVNNSIILKTQKTGSQVRIPLNHASQSLLNFDLDGIKLFERTIKQSNSRITTDLNDALDLINIKSKKISFHCSRHTFAINSFILGIPLEVVSKILGHSDLKTTQIYAKVVDSLMNREMDKWNNVSFPS
jgi:integrase